MKKLLVILVVIFLIPVKELNVDYSCKKEDKKAFFNVPFWLSAVWIKTPKDCKIKSVSGSFLYLELSRQDYKNGRKVAGVEDEKKYPEIGDSKR